MNIVRKFRRLVKEHGGNYEPFSRSAQMARAWWDAYGDMTNCHILFGRMCEVIREHRREWNIYLTHNWVTLERLGKK